MPEPVHPSPLPAADELAEQLTERLVHAVITARSFSEHQDIVKVRAAIANVVREHVDWMHTLFEQCERFAVLGRMSASLAHELRNPLSVIETSAYILTERTRSDERAARHARRIVDQASIASALVNDILDIARDRPPSDRPVDVAAIVRAAVAQVPCPPTATLRLHVPADLPPVRADERQIRQVLTNLLHNALEATGGSGEVTLTATVRDRRVAVTVRDNGPGIAPEHMSRLFDPLFTTKASGTGLGLWRSRAIARAHGGDLIAGNHPSGGAWFELTLPVANSPEDAK